MSNTKKKLVRLLIALFVTLAPIAVFKSVWHIIKIYLPLVNATAMVMVGSMLIFMYLKGYSWGSLAWRFQNMFIEKQDFREYMKQRFEPDPMYKSKSVLVVGIILIMGAMYLLNSYRISSAEQENVRVIRELRA